MTQGIQKGRFYTMSAMNNRIGDRSWMGRVWEVVEATPTHALIINAAPRYPSEFGADKPMVVVIEEFDWYDADTLIAAMADYGVGRVEQ